MTRLHIDLREGFDGDDVEIDVDGRRVYARSGVRTGYAVGLADSVEVEVAGAADRVRVRLRNRGLAAEKSLKLQTPVQFLAVTASPTAVGLAGWTRRLAFSSGRRRLAGRGTWPGGDACGLDAGGPAAPGRQHARPPAAVGGARRRSRGLTAARPRAVSHPPARLHGATSGVLPAGEG